MSVSNPPATDLYCTTDWTGKQVPKGGLGFIKYALTMLESLEKVKGMLASIALSRRNTRPGYPPAYLWRLHSLKFLLGEPYNLSLIQRLKSSTELRALCGFGEQVPSEATVSRFFKKMAEDFRELGEQFVLEMVKRLARYLPSDFGRVCAIDSTDVPSFANGDGGSLCDTYADWGRRTRKRAHRSKGSEDTEPFFGRKLHMLIDAVNGLVICYIILPASKNDSPILPKLIEKAKALYGADFSPEILLGDRGYDATTNFAYLIENEVEPVILARKPTAADGLYHGEFNKDGLPVCDDGRVLMEYVQSEGNRHMFKCPATGCAMKSKSSGAMRYCDTTALWIESTPDKTRGVGWKLPKANREKWFEVYDERQVVERFFSSAKQSRLLTKNNYLKPEKIELHLNLAILLYIATQATHLAADDFENVLKMRIRF